MTNQQKQQLYELLVILGSLSLAGYNDAESKKDIKQQQFYRTFARQNIKTLLDVPVEKIQLTSDGLIVED